MKEKASHPYISTLQAKFADGEVDRREFLRTATLLGMSAAAAYGFVGRIAGEAVVAPARAATATGGTLRIGSRIKAIDNPATYSWGQYDSNISRQVCEYLTLTGRDNVTRPYLLEKWEPSEDLKTWTLYLRKDVKWRDGRPFTAQDVAWNLNHVLDEKTGSSMIGLMKGYMLEDYDTGEKDDAGNPKMGTRLWSDKAIEIVDDHTVRLNANAPQLAVPEHLFHYPMAILDPKENGKFGVGSNGTGPFELVELEVGRKAAFKARTDYWGEAPKLETLEFIDVGDDPSAAVASLISGQIDGLGTAGAAQLDALKAVPRLTMYRVSTAQTAVARMKVTEKPFDDPRVRKAMRLAVNTQEVLGIALRDLGLTAEHHHVAPIHPEYAKLPPFNRDVAAAKALLAEAGHPNGIEIEIWVANDYPWHAVAIQAMANQWKEASIKVDIKVVPGATYWDVWTKVPVGFTVWYHRPLGIMCLGLAYRTGVPWNESSYANPEFDRLLTKAEGIIDVEKRREVMAEIEKIMQEDGPIIQPVWEDLYTFMDKKVQGFNMHPTGYIFGNELSIQS
jgi:peptide/nickel transport system substrate-binding protein